MEDLIDRIMRILAEPEETRKKDLAKDKLLSWSLVPKSPLKAEPIFSAAVVERRRKFVNFVVESSLDTGINDEDQFARLTYLFVDRFTDEEKYLFVTNWSSDEMLTLFDLAKLLSEKSAYDNANNYETVFADKQMQDFIAMLPERTRENIVTGWANSARLSFSRNASLSYEKQVERFARSVWNEDTKKLDFLNIAVMYNTQLSAAEINDIHSLTLGSSNFEKNIQAGIILETTSDVVEAYYKKIEGDPNAAELARYWILNKGPGDVERLLPLINTNVIGNTPDGKKLMDWLGENFSSLSVSSKNTVCDLFNQDPTVVSRFPQSFPEGLWTSLVEHALKKSTSGDNTSLMKSYIRRETPDLQLYLPATGYILQKDPAYPINFTDFFQNTKNYSNELKECFNVVFTKLIDINNSTQLRIKPIELNINASLINTIPDDHMVVLLKCMQNNDAFKFVNDSKLHLLDYAANNLFSIPADMHSGLLLERFKEVTARLDRSEELSSKPFISRDITMSPFYPGLWRNFEDAEKVAFLKVALPVFVKSNPLTQQELAPTVVSMVNELDSKTISALFKDTDSLLSTPMLQDKRLNERFLESATPKNLFGYITRNPLRLDSRHDFFAAVRSMDNPVVESLLTAIDVFKDRLSDPWLHRRAVEVLDWVLKEKDDNNSFEGERGELSHKEYYGRTNPSSIIMALETILRCNIKAQIEEDTLSTGHIIALSALGYIPVSYTLVENTIKQNPALLAAFIHQQQELNNAIDPSYLDAAKEFPQFDAVTAAAERHATLKNERDIKNKLKDRFDETIISKRSLTHEPTKAVLGTRRIHEVVSLNERQLSRLEQELDIVDVKKYVKSLNTDQCIQRAHNLMHEFKTGLLDNTLPFRTDVSELDNLLDKVITNSKNDSEHSNKHLIEGLEETRLLLVKRVESLSPGPLEQALAGSPKLTNELASGLLDILRTRETELRKLSDPRRPLTMLETLSVALSVT